MYLSSHSVCNEKIASSNPTYTTVFNILVRLLKTMNHRQDLVQIWLKSAVWYATAPYQGIKGLPATSIILAFVEAQIWSTGII